MDPRVSAINGLGTEAILETLRRKGIQFWVENGGLRYRARKGSVTAEDAARLRYVGQLYARRDGPASAASFVPYVLPRPHGTRFPLAFSQLEYWNLRASSGFRPFRQVASATGFRGRLDEDTLNEALSLIVSRHESLRTRIIMGGGEPLQEVADHCDRELSVTDLTAVATEQLTEEVQRRIFDVITDAADYAIDPLFKASLLRLGENEKVLILALDHMVSDGVSLGIVLRELVMAYTQMANGRAMSLPPVHMQLADYAVWQRQGIYGLLHDQASIWSGWKRTAFPVDPQSTGEAGWATVRFLIDAPMKAALGLWARSRGTSLVMTVLTAYVAMLSRWCETETVSLLVMSDGRMSRLVENTIGYLAFPLYMRIQLAGGDTFSDMLEKVTTEYCWAGERLDFCYSCAQTPQPDFVNTASFNWLPTREEPVTACENGERTLKLSRIAFKNPFLETLDWEIEPWVVLQNLCDEIVAEVGYPRNRFSQATMQKFAENFGVVLSTLVNRAGTILRDILMI